MGDRANFGFRQSDGNIIFVYGHWAGHGMMSQLANALNEVTVAGRLDDEPYANRIAISQLIGEEWSQNLSWGITVNYVSDNEHAIPVVDWNRAQVSLFDYGTDFSHNAGDPKVTFTISDFIKRYSKVGVTA